MPGAPRAGENGNWACEDCGNVNFPAREKCNRCKLPRSQGGGGGGGYNNFASPALESNPYYSQQAPSYNSSSAYEPYSMPGRMMGGGMGGRGMGMGMGGYITRGGAGGGAGGGFAPPPARSVKDILTQPGNWKCPKSACGNINFPQRTVCNLCSTPKIEGERKTAACSLLGLFAKEKGTENEQEGANAVAAAIDYLNSMSAEDVQDALVEAKKPTPTSSLSGGGGKRQRVGGGWRAPVAGENGNWLCVSPGCGNVNFPQRTQCNTCGASPP